jgi:vacuolar-type H+-ATPase subunit E/Vma4
LNNRRRLQAARSSIEAELQAAIATVKWEAKKKRAREAKKIVANLRQRGPNIGLALRTALQEYDALQEDMANPRWSWDDKDQRRIGAGKL